MQKRVFKFNILDLVIFIVIICAIAVLVFRSNINEMFEGTESVTLEISLDVAGEDNVSQTLDSLSKTVMFEPESGKDTVIEVNVAEVEISPDSKDHPDEARVVVACIGYKKLGRYYTENGERIYNNTESALLINGNRVECKVIFIDEKGL